MSESAAAVSLNERNQKTKGDGEIEIEADRKEKERKTDIYKVCLSMFTNSASARGRNTKAAVRSNGQFGSMGPVGCHVGPLPSLPLLLDWGGHYGSPLPLHHRPQHLPVSQTPYIW